MRLFSVLTAVLLVGLAGRAGERIAPARRSGPGSGTNSSGGLNAEELRRLNDILKEKEGKNARSMKDNVLLRVTRYDTEAKTEAVRSLLLGLDVKQGIGKGKVTGQVTGHPKHTALDGLNVRFAYHGPSNDASATLRRQIEDKLGSRAHTLSLMTQVERKSHVEILTRSDEVWAVEYRRPTPDNNVVPQEPVLIENVVGTGLEVFVAGMSKRAVVLKITPYFRTRLEDDGRSRFARVLVEELETTVAARPGEPIVLGGVSEKKKDVVNSVFSNREQGGSRCSMIVLRAYPHSMMSGVPASEREPEQPEVRPPMERSTSKRRSLGGP